MCAVWCVAVQHGAMQCGTVRCVCACGAFLRSCVHACMREYEWTSVVRCMRAVHTAVCHWVLHAGSRCLFFCTKWRPIQGARKVSPCKFLTNLNELADGHVWSDLNCDSWISLNPSRCTEANKQAPPFSFTDYQERCALRCCKETSDSATSCRCS